MDFPARQIQPASDASHSVLRGDRRDGKGPRSEPLRAIPPLTIVTISDEPLTGTIRAKLAFGTMRYDAPKGLKADFADEPTTKGLAATGRLDDNRPAYPRHQFRNLRPPDRGQREKQNSLSREFRLLTERCAVQHPTSSVNRPTRDNGQDAKNRQKVRGIR